MKNKHNTKEIFKNHSIHIQCGSGGFFVGSYLINRIKYLRKKGYKIALDDFVDNVKHALSQKKIILAEKIETQEDFQKALEMGFHLFQGVFF